MSMSPRTAFIVHTLQALGALALGVTAATSAHAQPIPIPGTSVTISPPAGFTLSRAFSGLENAATGSSITVTELPQEAFGEISRLFATTEAATAQFAKQGIQISEVKQVATAGGPIPFAVGRQAANGVEIIKYVALFGGAQTALVTFNITNPSAITLSGAETVVQSVTLGRAATLEEKLAQSGVSVRAVAPFHIADVLAGNGILLTTFEGTDPTGTKPAIIIARALNAVPAADAPQIGEQLMRAMDGFATAQVTDQRSLQFAGGDAHFIAAVANGRTLLQLTRIPADRRYLRFVALGETSAIEAARGAIMEIASSVSLAN